MTFTPQVCWFFQEYIIWHIFVHRWISPYTFLPKILGGLHWNVTGYVLQLTSWSAREHSIKHRHKEKQLLNLICLPLCRVLSLIFLWMILTNRVYVYYRQRNYSTFVFQLYYSTCFALPRFFLAFILKKTN